MKPTITMRKLCNHALGALFVATIMHAIGLIEFETFTAAIYFPWLLVASVFIDTHFSKP